MKDRTLCSNKGLTPMWKNVKEKISEANFEMPKISHEEFCTSFLVMILMFYSEGYCEFLV
jgi:hypothetical protein